MRLIADIPRQKRKRPDCYQFMGLLLSFLVLVMVICAALFELANLFVHAKAP